jgi:HAD superfamily phosphoserine phosphatase-like hydrolase
VERTSTSALVARLDRDHGAPGVVAFDGDGTLWSGDVGEDFMHAALTRGEVREPATLALRALTGRSASGAELARYLFAEYMEHRFPEDGICEVIAWLHAGFSREEVRAIVVDVLASEGLAGRIHGEAATVLAWARSRGHEVFVVSASPQHVVEEAAALVGVDAAHVLAVRPRFTGDRMAAEVERPIPYGPGKVAALEAVLAGRPLLAAFGDNAFDVPMLARARFGVGIRPKQRLRDAAVGHAFFELDAEDPSPPAVK